VSTCQVYGSTILTSITAGWVHIGYTGTETQIGVEEPNEKLDGPEHTLSFNQYKNKQTSNRSNNCLLHNMITINIGLSNTVVVGGHYVKWCNV